LTRWHRPLAAVGATAWGHSSSQFLLQSMELSVQSRVDFAAGLPHDNVAEGECRIGDEIGALGQVGMAEQTAKSVTKLRECVRVNRESQAARRTRAVQGFPRPANQ